MDNERRACIECGGEPYYTVAAVAQRERERDRNGGRERARTSGRERQEEAERHIEREKQRERARERERNRERCETVLREDRGIGLPETHTLGRGPLV